MEVLGIEFFDRHIREASFEYTAWSSKDMTFTINQYNSTCFEAVHGQWEVKGKTAEDALRALRDLLRMQAIHLMSVVAKVQD